jgi:error-prone DNA polymerase
MLPSYSELHCLSNFTFLRGASHPEELVERAAALGYSALAITDECSVAGAVRAHLAAKECGLHLIVGAEFRLDDGLRFVLLATNRNGYGNLAELITAGRRAAEKGAYRLTRADLERGVADCLALWLPGEPPQPDDARWLAVRFPDATWIAVELLRGPDDAGQLAALQAIGTEIGLPLVAAGDVHMHVRARKRLQDVLTAIRLGTPVARCGQALFPNGERHLRAMGRLAKIYPPELLAETLAVAARCEFSLDELRYEYPEELVPPDRSPATHLRELAYAGMTKRYPDGAPENVRALVEHELALIRELAYEPYFLTVHDIVRFARERDILCQGRGSAANSAVCYCLGITEVDPSRSDLLFERFISRERNEPPDIDVDFEHQRREEVMQYIYEKYGRHRAALAATLITYRPKSALRDVGKALGLSLDQVDRLAGSMAWWDGRRIKPERLMEAGFDPDNPTVRLALDRVHELLGFPRHLSQHVGGFVIARDRLSRLVPVENAAMAQRTVIQWDKDDLDALGLLKVDILALGMLTTIRRALDLVRAHRGVTLTMQQILERGDDPQVYEMIRHADTVGVFQIESRAQMSMLPRLKPHNFYDLVIEIAIVRPGPIQGGMVHPYLRRREGVEPVDYPSEAVKKVLSRTLGVPIFQEQVMQLAVVAAGFTPGEADQLRRAMATFRRRGGMDKHRDRLIAGMLSRGYSSQYAERIFRQIEGFGEYGFPESHSASFALLAYVSAWLKRHEPTAFSAALLNSQPMGFYAPSQLVQDAQRHGVEVRPVDVAVSDWDCTLEQGAVCHPRGSGDPVVGGDARWVPACAGTTTVQPSLRLGMRQVKGLSEKGAKRLMAARAERPFADVGDLARRAQLDRRDLDALAAADALASLVGHRRAALWATTGIELRAGSEDELLAGAACEERQPSLLPPTEGENVVGDYARLGLTLRSHPVRLLRPRLTALRLMTAAEVQAANDGSIVRAAGIVTCRQRPGTASGVTFVTLEDETGVINVVVWRNLAERQRRELLAARLLGVYGKVERQGEVVHLVAGRLVDHTRLLGRLTTPSRDFH